MREYGNVASISGAGDIKAALSEHGGVAGDDHQAPLDEW
jgi:hypothetical protein